MTANFVKRILFDIKLYESSKEEVNKDGIYINYSLEDVTRMTMMIVGPKDTPYQYGFYLFDITLPYNYPLEPPKIRFMTQSDKIRFHPNFYVEGYVCLSILNTWGKDEWSLSQNIVSIARTIQSVMNSNPINNEPDYEDEIGIIAQDYVKIVRFYNIKAAVCDMIENCPLAFRSFYKDAKKLFLENYDQYTKVIDQNEPDQDSIITCQTYSLSVRINYHDLKFRIKKIKEKLDKEKLNK